MIQIQDLSKSLGKREVINKLSLHIKQGELFGLAGPNGAGKTTLINILSTFMRPDKGEVLIDGLDVLDQKNKVRKIIGLIPQDISLYGDLSAQANLEFWGRIYKLRKSQLKDRINYILEKVGLIERRYDQIKTYSGGMKRRLNLAAGLLHDPKVIFLDEPTVGVDPHSRNFIFELIKELNKEGKTIIYTSHYLEEIEKLCSRIGIFEQGRLIALGTKEDLYKLLPDEDAILIRFSEPIELIQYQKKLKMVVQVINQTTLRIVSGQMLNELPNILEKIRELPGEIKEIQILKPNLEQVFLSLTGREFQE